MDPVHPDSAADGAGEGIDGKLDGGSMVSMAMAALQGGRERCEACEREEKKKGRGGALLTGGEETAWRGTDLVVAGGATDEDGGVRIQRPARWSEAEEAGTFEDTGIGGDAA